MVLWQQSCNVSKENDVFSVYMFLIIFTRSVGDISRILIQHGNIFITLR